MQMVQFYPTHYLETMPTDDTPALSRHRKGYRRTIREKQNTVVGLIRAWRERERNTLFRCQYDEARQ